MEHNNIQLKIQQYFRAKTNQILALSEQAVTDHSGLIGSHREAVFRQFLKEIFPKRYSIDKGMVYGLIGRSREADIVIWDEVNYPKLCLYDSNIFFMEGVKAIIEVKSNWSNEVFEDIKAKAHATINIFGNYGEGISRQIQKLEDEIWSLKSGSEYQGTLISPNRKGSISIVYYGGQEFDIENLEEEEIEKIEDDYPDILLLLSAGKIIIKRFIPDEQDPLKGIGYLEQIECHDDLLLLFTVELLDFLAISSEHIEPPLSLANYLYGLFQNLQCKNLQFNLTRPIAGNMKNFWNK